MLYEKLKAANIPMSNHYSDLYAKVTPESEKIIFRYEYSNMVRQFISEIDNTLWYDIPFAYQPYWDNKPTK